jgi:hypothetical protein
MAGDGALRAVEARRCGNRGTERQEQQGERGTADVSGHGGLPLAMEPAR